MVRRYFDLEELPTTVDDALHSTLSEVLENGQQLNASGNGSTVELLGYYTGMKRPTARITAHSAHRLNIVSAVARFVWMMAGSDRLEDIAYYEPKVRPYTDDEISVPGSSYGHRLFNYPWRTSQVDGAIDRLRRGGNTRQAAVVIWRSEDAVRVSADIPCAFGLFFHARGDGLIATCVMRSNNALRLLPYNFFEFSLLSEVVAAEVGLPMVAYVHWSASMHVYERDRQLAEEVISAGPGTAIEMPPVPAREPLRQARKVAEWEARIRHSPSGRQVRTLRQQAAGELDTYWTALLDVLVAHNLRVRGAEADIQNELPDYLRPHF